MCACAPAVWRDGDGRGCDHGFVIQSFHLVRLGCEMHTTAPRRSLTVGAAAGFNPVRATSNPLSGDGDALAVGALHHHFGARRFEHHGWTQVAKFRACRQVLLRWHRQPLRFCWQFENARIAAHPHARWWANAFSIRRCHSQARPVNPVPNGFGRWRRALLSQRCRRKVMRRAHPSAAPAPASAPGRARTSHAGPPRRGCPPQWHRHGLASPATPARPRLAR